MGHPVQIEIVKISPQISHVQAERKYLMEDLSWKKRKEIKERERKHERKNSKVCKTMEKVERGRTGAKFRS